MKTPTEPKRPTRVVVLGYLDFIVVTRDTPDWAQYATYRQEYIGKFVGGKFEAKVMNVREYAPGYEPRDKYAPERDPYRPTLEERIAITKLADYATKVLANLPEL
jgi:hypothetical protein